MANVPRRSEFSLTDDEKDMLRKQNDKELKKYIEKGIEKTEEGASASLLINLFYDIGMQDYWIYRDANNNTPKQKLYDWVKKCLKTRASDSARLQVLLEDMKLKGYDIDKILNPKLGEIFKYETHDNSSIDTLYQLKNYHV